MTLDPTAVGSKGGPRPISWTHKDVMLYAVGIGAGHDDLAFSTEHAENTTATVYPTFAVVAGADRGMPPGMNALSRIGTYDLGSVVHGAHAVEVHQPIPLEASAVVRDEVVAMYDKGSASVVTVEDKVTLETGDPLWTNRMTVFIRGVGGWGGERGPSGTSERPAGNPDHVVSMPTSRDQAFVYRLSGDRNPLHVDPIFAARAGFEQPILHGLCTYGVTARALLRTLLADDVARWRMIDGRFSSPVIPGETLTVSMWVLADGEAAFTTAVGDRIVIDNGRLRYEPEQR